MLSEVKGDIKNTWKVLKTVINKNVNHKYKKGCTSFSDNNCIISDPSLISSKFNEFFTNVGPNLAKDIPVVENNVTEFLTGEYTKSMFLTATNKDEIFKLIMNEKSNKSSGYDNLSINVIKHVATEISVPLSKIFNNSFQQGTVPCNMKIAKIIPIFKSGNSDQFCNYRPISLLPTFSKILERVFYKRLIDYVNANNILTNNQYGFREKSSTTFALIDLIDDLSNSIEKKEYTIGVFLDLKKAFDTIDHTLLLRKLEFYGIRGVSYQWIKSYLENRKQFVSYNNVSSDHSNVICGIPQGSVLGPLLFILYINDICNVSNILKFILFADDTNVFYSDKNIKNLIVVLNKELIKLSLWFKVNKLSLNILKTNFILFKTKARFIPDNIDVCIDDVKITRVAYTKFLGVVIDENLDWKEHISTIENKVSKSIGLLYRAKLLLNSKDLHVLYSTLVLPYLLYCIPLWGHTYQSRLNKLVKLQKKAIRIVDKADYIEHTLPIFKKYNAMTLNDICRFSTATIMYKIMQCDVPQKIQNMVNLVNNVHSYETRQTLNCYIYPTRTVLKSQTFRIQGPMIWNQLNDVVKNKLNIYSFKRNL